MQPWSFSRLVSGCLLGLPVLVFKLCQACNTDMIPLVLGIIQTLCNQNQNKLWVSNDNVGHFGPFLLVSNPKSLDIMNKYNTT